MVSPVESNIPQTQTSGVASEPNLSSSSVSNTSNATTQLYSDTLSTLSLANKGQLALLTTANNPKIPKPALFEVMQTVSQATVANKQINYDQSVAVNLKKMGFYRDMIYNADNLLKILQEIIGIQYDTTRVALDSNVQITQQNIINAIYTQDPENRDAYYNELMHNAAETYNSAYTLYQQQTQAYLNGDITAAEYANDTSVFNSVQNAYNDAVSQYNNYASSRQDTINAYNQQVTNYNNQVDQNNTKIEEVNKERAKYDLDPLPLQEKLELAPTLPSASSAPPSPATVLPIIDYSNIAPQIPLYNVPQPTDLISAVFVPLLLLRFSVLGQIKYGLKLIGNVRQFVDYYLSVKTSVYALPGAYASQTATSNTSTSGSATNAGLASIASGLDPSIVYRMYNQGTRNAYYQEFNDLLKPGTIDAVLLATANILAGASLITGQQMSQLLKDDVSGKTIDGSNLGKALSLGFITNILDIVFKDVLSSSLEEYLKGTQQNIAALNPLSSLVNLSSLALALNALSSTLGLQGLGSQLLNLAGIDQSTIFNLTSQGVGFSDFSSNPFAQQLVSKQLSTQIIQSLGLSPETAASLQGSLENAVLQAAQQTSPFASSTEFSSQLAQTLSNNSISGQTANNVLDAAAQALSNPIFTSRVAFRDDIQQSLIQQGYSSEDALAIASATAGVSPTATNDTLLNPTDIQGDVLASNIAYNMSLAGINSPSEIASKVASAFLANNKEIAEDTARQDIQYQLQKQGIDADQARRVATGISIPVSSQNNPLSTVSSTSFLSQADLHQQLLNSISDVYGPILGSAKAQAHAQTLADALVGPANANAKDINDQAHPPSLVRSISDHLNVLKENENQALYNKAVDSFKDYIKPSVDLFAFNERLLDPATKIYYANEVMYLQPTQTGPVMMGGTNRALESPV